MSLPPAPSVLSEQHKTGFSGNIELLTEHGPYAFNSPTILNKTVKVWNGSAFVEGTPRQVVGNKAMQFVTSEGRVVRCAPDQLVPLGDNTFKPAKDLKVGDVLARSVMPEYPGRADQTQADTFKRGCIYGYAIANFGDPVPELPLLVSAPITQEYISVPIHMPQRDPKNPEAPPRDVRSPHLVDLGYAVKRSTKDGAVVEEDIMRPLAVDYARGKQLQFDHEANALILLPEAERQPRTFPNAPLRDRKLWAAGCAHTSHQYQGLTGPRANIAAVVTMINGLGPQYEVDMFCADAFKNRWAIRHFRVAPEKRAPPTVFSVSALTGDSVMYNVDGDAVGTVMVNGQLVSTGACE